MTVHPYLFIADMVSQLTQKDYQRLEDQKTTLIEQNERLVPQTRGFLFHGEFVTNMPVKEQKHAIKKLLHKDLHDEGRAYFKDRKILSNETKRLVQAFSTIVKDAQSLQDVRDALPDACLPFLNNDITALPRTRPEGYLYDDKPLKRHEYDETCQLMLFYSANNILY